MSITPGEIAGMTDQQLDELRRQVMDARDQRVHAAQSQASRAAERKRAADVVRQEIRAYLAAGGTGAQLQALLDRVVTQLQREIGAAEAAAAKGTAGGGTVG